MIEADRTKLVILLCQFTPCARLSAMEVSATLEFIEGRGFTIERPENFDLTKLTIRNQKEIFNDQPR